MKGKAILIATWIGRGTFKAAALVGAFVLIVALYLHPVGACRMGPDDAAVCDPRLRVD